MKNIKEMIINLKNRGDVRFLDSASEEQIRQFEETNHFVLPEQYKEFLMYSDGGEIYLPAGIQLYGVAHKPIIDVNENDRPSDEYIVIGALATGDPILCKKNENVIAIYNHEDGIIEDDEIYIDFYSFLEDLENLLGIER